MWSREAAESQEDEASQAAGPSAVDAAFKLNVEEGAVVEAQFPFFGDIDAAQLSFQIGDSIKVVEKNELWSWGLLLRTGEEGW